MVSRCVYIPSDVYKDPTAAFFMLFLTRRHGGIEKSWTRCWYSFARYHVSPFTNEEFAVTGSEKLFGAETLVGFLISLKNYDQAESECAICFGGTSTTQIKLDLRGRYRI